MALLWGWRFGKALELCPTALVLLLMLPQAAVFQHWLSNTPGLWVGERALCVLRLLSDGGCCDSLLTAAVSASSEILFPELGPASPSVWLQVCELHGLVLPAIPQR